MLAQLSESLQLFLTGLLVVWPAKPATCHCSGAASHSLALEDSLTFCQETARECRAKVQLSGFWLGFICGLLVSSVLLACFWFLRRCLGRIAPTAAVAERPQPQPQRGLEAAAAVIEIQPATPARLRALGLA